MEHLHIKLSEKMKNKLKIRAIEKHTNLTELVIELIKKELEEKKDED